MWRRARLPCSESKRVSLLDYLSLPSNTYSDSRNLPTPPYLVPETNPHFHLLGAPGTETHHVPIAMHTASPPRNVSSLLLKRLSPCIQRRDLLLTMSRDRTAVLWDLSRSRHSFSAIDSTATAPALQRHPSWGAGAYTSEEGADVLSLSGGGAGGGGESGYGECSPARVSTTFGLPHTAPGMCPATVVMLPLSRPPPPAKLLPGAAFERGTTRGGGGGVGSVAAAAAAGVSMFGEGFSARGNGGRTTGRAEQGGKLPVLFAASGDRMVASVVHREVGRRQGGGNGDEEEGLEEEVHPVRFVGPTGKTVDSKKGSGGMRSGSGGGALVVRSVAVLPLRRLSLLGCADGWVRVGT